MKTSASFDRNSNLVVPHLPDNPHHRTLNRASDYGAPPLTLPLIRHRTIINSLSSGHHQPRNDKKKIKLKQCADKMSSYQGDQPVNDYLAERSENQATRSEANCHRFTESDRRPSTKPGKSSRISFLNSALQSVAKINRRGECKRKSKANRPTEKSSTPPSVYLEEHKGMDWRLQQLGYQLPEQDERLLTDNPHLSNELKFLRLQQKLSSIPVRLYINGSGSPGNNSTNSSANSSSNNSSCNSDHSTGPEQPPEHETSRRPICCAKCEQVISKSTYCVQADLGNFSFVVSAAKSGEQHSTVPQTVFFHIDCLQCVTCGEILVDFRAYLDPRTVIDDLVANQLRIYCSRHFLELFKPRCELCEELIFDKKCTQAENKAWHVNHFTCHQCKVPLGGQQYKMADLNQRTGNMDDKMRLEDLHKAVQRQQTKEVHPFCLSCCDQLFGEYCARCDKLITCDQNPVKFEKYFWHATPECFHCDTCGITLVNSDYLPSSTAKQIFCSTKCAQSLQAKDLNNMNSGLMKLNDRLRNSHHKPTLNSVQEEDYNSLDDPVDRPAVQSSKVEYENLKSELFQVSTGDRSDPTAVDQPEDAGQQNSPSHSSRSSNRSLSSLSLLFSCSPSSPESSREEPKNGSTASDERLKNDETPLKSAAANSPNSSPSIESVCSAESNQLNSSTSVIDKEIKSSEPATDESSKQVKKVDVDEDVVDNKQPPIGEPADQRLVPFAIVNNNPFTRTSIIIDNLNTALSALQMLDDEERSPNKDDARSSSAVSSPALSKSPNSDSSSRNDKNNDSPSSTDLVQEGNARTAFPSSLSGQNAASFVNAIQPPTHYSTLPVRRTQRKPFRYEEPTVQTMSNYYRFLNVQNGCKFPAHTNSSPQSLISAKPVVDLSMNEVGLPVPSQANAGPSAPPLNQHNRLNHFNQFNHFNVNLSSFVNCTLPRTNRHHNQALHQTPEGGYLNGVHSVSISKLNAMMLQSSLARVPGNNLGNLSNNLNGNQSINTSTNSDFSIASSTSTPKLSINSSAMLTSNVNSHSVVVSEDQIERLDSQLIVKPLPNGAAPKPLPPHQHGFIKKWSATASNSSSINSGGQLGDLPVIQEHLSSDHPSERTSSATPSLSSSIETQSSNEKEECAIEGQHKNYSSSNNSLNNTINQTNLNSSNSASLLSGTSSINSTNSSNSGEMTPQLTGLIHNRPDVICFLNPIETIKQQLKQKERELKLKERMLKKAEQQSIESLKPKIVEEKLKTSTPTAEKPAGNRSASTVGEAKEGKMLHHTSHKRASARTMSTNNINEIREIQANGQLLNAKLTGNRHAVSNSLSSLNRPVAASKNSADCSQLAHRSQPNLFIGNPPESNGETCSSSSTPDHIERQFNQLNQFNDRLNKFNQLTQHLNQFNHQSTNPSPSSQYSPTNSVSATNDTDCSSLVNSVEMDNRVQFQNGESSLQQAHKKRTPQQSALKDAQQLKQLNQHGGKACETQAGLQKQKSVSFDPNVIENEKNKAPKRLSRSHKKKPAGRSDSYEPSARCRRRRLHRSSGHSDGHSYQHDHYHHGGYKSSRRRRHYHYEDDDFCSTCSDSSCSSSSSVCSSSSDEDDKVDRRRRSGHPAVTCHGRMDQLKHSDQANDKLSQLAGGTKKAGAKLQAGASSTAAEKMVELMQQQHLIIQQQLALQQMHPQSKQQRYLKNNTNESCVIS